MAALGVVGCGVAGCASSDHPAASPSPSTPGPNTTSTVALPAPIPDTPGGPPLPPAASLTEVMARLSDPAVPGAEKITLIEQGTPAEAAGLDRFAAALRDNGSLPLILEARDLAWSQSAPGHVLATIVIRPADPAAREFVYPMEFAPAGADSWQLTRRTADLFLQLDGPAPAPPPEPAPAPAPTPPR